MKIILISNERRTEVEDNAEVIDDVIQLFKQALLGHGFHPESVKRGFEEYE